MHKYTTTACTTAAEALNNIANEFAHVNGTIDMLVQLILTEKSKSDANHLKCEAEEAKREAEENAERTEREKREAARQKREDEREAKREAEEAIDNLNLRVGMKFELLNIIKKNGPLNLGTIFEIVELDMTHYEVRARVRASTGEESDVTEGTIKRMLRMGFLKQA